MTTNRLCRLVLGALAVSAICPTTSPALGQLRGAPSSTIASEDVVPRTAWGDPDLQGLWTNIAEINVPLERPRELASTPQLTEEQSRERTRIAVEHYDVNPGAFRSYVPSRRVESPGRPTGPIGGPAYWTERSSGTSLATGRVVDPPDGRLPASTAEAQQRRVARAEARRGRAYASWVELGPWQRCITRGLPASMEPTGYNANYAILQVPGYVIIQYEMIHDTRVIPIDGRPRLDDRLQLWMGDSRGHWEGTTLVVEVSNFNEEGARAGAHGANGASLQLVERFTRVGAERIDYRATVHDPTTWSRSWTIASILTRDDDQVQIFEYACHEGNYGMAHTLSGARVEEE